jgi:hypothetical protein
MTNTTQEVFRARIVDNRTHTESGVALFADVGPAKHYLDEFALVRMNATTDSWRESNADGPAEWTARLEGVDAVAIVTMTRLHQEASSLVDAVRGLHADTTVDTIEVTPDA